MLIAVIVVFIVGCTEKAKEKALTISKQGEAAVREKESR